MPRNDPLSRISATETPQTKPIPGRNMVKNDAGGYVFDKSVLRKVEDFIILGVSDGTYYIGKDELTTRNVDFLINAVKADGVAVVKLIEDISTSKPPRAPKNRPAIFALALVFAYGDADAVQAAKAVFSRVVRTTDHLSQFFGYAKQFHGKVVANGTSLMTGRALRSALGSWFYSSDSNRVAYKVCKARQRKTPAGERLDLLDVLRVAHPKPDSPERALLLGWIAGKVNDEEARHELYAVDNFLKARGVTSEREAVDVVRRLHVPWEFLPSEYAGTKEVWKALAPTVGITALVRNLAHMTRLGVFEPFSSTTHTVVRRLTDADALREGRIHPMDLFLALRVYKSGEAQPNPSAPRREWTPNPEIIDALEKAYELSFGYVEPSGRRQLIAVDSSGSMGGVWGWSQVTLGGSPIGSPYELACCMAVILKRIEGPNVHVIDVDTRVHASRITARTNLREIGSWNPSGGGTNLSLPFAYAARENLTVDGFTILSDMETWAGRSHPVQNLNSYRARFNSKAKVVAVAMSPAGWGIMDPKTPGVLQVAGFDASLPKLVTEFMR